MVEKKTTQTMRFSDEELKLLKNTFGDRADLLMLIRQSFWQRDILEKDDIMLKGVLIEPVMKVLRKFFLPELNGELPFTQEIDLLMTVKIDDKTPEEAYPHIMARGIVIDYIKQQLDEMIGKITEDKRLLLSDMLDFNLKEEEVYIGLVARNTIINHIEQQLLQINLLSEKKDETPEEAAKRLKQDSSK